MNEIVSYIVSAIPSGALPIVVLLLGLAYLYFKFGKVEKDREETKTQRDKDSQEIHDTLMHQTFDIANIKGRIELHDTILSDINKQINILNTNLAILTEKIDNLTNTLKEVKNDRQIQSK